MTQADGAHNEEQYRRGWEIARQVSKAAAADVPRAGLEAIAAGIGLLEGSEVVVESDEEMTVFFDHAIYDYREAGTTAVERAIARRRPGADAETTRVLDALAASRYALLEVRSVAPEAGVWVHDALSGEELLLMDPGLGRSAHVGLVLASHVIVFESFAMTTGALWPVSPEAWQMIQATLTALLRGPLEGFRELDRDTQGRIVTMILRFCLAGAATEESAGPETPEEPETA